jgi:glycerophosphoryl diester phosphodiesterase
MKFIGHRGYSKLYPENSLAAFEAVASHPLNGSLVAGIELDIHLTSDSKIPVMHETSLPDGTGLPVPVYKVTFDQLQDLHKKRNGPKPIPSLEETLKLIRHRTGLCLEIKTGDYDHRAFTKLLIKMLTGYSPAADVVISSFSFDLLKMVMDADKGLGLKYGFLLKTWESFDVISSLDEDTLDFLHPSLGLVLEDPDVFNLKGIPLQVWTVNYDSDLRALKNCSCGHLISSVMTDDLSMAERFKGVS